ncbi:T9SS type A sorting domain-containing protein [bacterium]|nr:T9SS type A sorting domain-containing protein [bacterium]
MFGLDSIVVFTLNFSVYFAEENSQATLRYNLKQNFPNPFNPTTTISYTLAKTNNVRLEVYNTKGELVRALVSENQNEGSHTSNWNGTDFSGKQVSSGIYFYRLETKNGFSEAKKMVLLK